MALVERLEMVWYGTGDWEAARAFYTTILGLPPTGDEGASDWLVFAPGGPVSLAFTRGGPDDLHGGAVPVFSVRDMDAALAALQAQGISCEPQAVEPDDA